MTEVQLAIAAAVAVLVVLLILVLGLSARRRSPAAPIEERLAVVEKDMISIERRLGETQHDVKNVRMMLQGMPSKDAVHALAMQVERLRGDWNASHEITVQTSRSVDRIEAYLLQVGTRAEVNAAARDAAHGRGED